MTRAPRSRFLDCLAETDPEIRAELLVRYCSPTVTYAGPSGPVTGYDALARAIAATQATRGRGVLAQDDVVVLATAADGRIASVAAPAQAGGAEARMSSAVAASAG